MKRLLVILLSCIMLFSVVSCQNGSDAVTTAKTAYGPEFSSAQIQQSSRGIHSLIGPTNYFNGDAFLAAAVMRDMPIMTSVRELTQAELTFDSVPPAFYAYDVKLRLQVIEKDGKLVTPCRVNSDGVFLRYEVLQEIEGKPDDVVGYLDYYYCWDTHSFSYRQYWVNTIEMEENFKHNGFMTLELIDIPVDTKTGAYSYGQLTEDNGLKVRKEDAVHDVVFLGDSSFNIDGNPADGYVMAVRMLPIFRNDGTTMYSSLVASNLHSTAMLPWNQVADFNEIAKKYDGNEGKIIPGNRDNFDLAFTMDMMQYLYSNGSEIAASDMLSENYRGHSYSSFKEFNNESIKEKSEATIYDKHGSFNACDTHTVFDFESRKGHTSFMPNVHAIYGIADIDNLIRENIMGLGAKLTEFKKYYNLIPTEPTPEEKAWYDFAYLYGGERNEYVKQFFKAHLEKCGITDENYMANLLYYLEMNGYLSAIWQKNGTEFVVDSRNPVAYRGYINDIVLDYYSNAEVGEKFTSIPSYPGTISLCAEATTISIPASTDPCVLEISYDHRKTGIDKDIYMVNKLGQSADFPVNLYDNRGNLIMYLGVIPEDMTGTISLYPYDKDKGYENLASYKIRKATEKEIEEYNSRCFTIPKAGTNFTVTVGNNSSTQLKWIAGDDILMREEPNGRFMNFFKVVTEIRIKDGNKSFDECLPALGNVSVDFRTQHWDRKGYSNKRVVGPYSEYTVNGNDSFDRVEIRAFGFPENTELLVRFNIIPLPEPVYEDIFSFCIISEDGKKLSVDTGTEPDIEWGKEYTGLPAKLNEKSVTGYRYYDPESGKVITVEPGIPVKISGYSMAFIPVYTK